MQETTTFRLIWLALFLCASVPRAAAIDVNFSTPVNTGAGVGETALYSNIGTQDGVGIDVLATIIDQGPIGQDNGLKAENGDLRTSLADGVTNATKWMTVTYDFFETGTNNPIIIRDLALTIDDLDGYSSRIESIQTSGITGYTLNDPSGVEASVSGDTYTFKGAAKHDPGEPEGAVLVKYMDSASIWITYKSELNVTGGAAAFYHDGGGDFQFDNPVETKRLYYTYRFANNSENANLKVDFFDSLPGGLLWDATFAPAITGSIDPQVAYSNGNRDASIAGLPIPPGGATMTLRTAPTSMTGVIDNDATITPAQPNSEPIVAQASIELGVSGGSGPPPPPVPPVFLDFCASQLGEYAVSVLDGGQFRLTNSDSGVLGSVAIGPGASWNIGSGGVSGQFATHPGSTGSGGDTQPGAGGDPISPVTVDLADLRIQALTLSAQAAELAATQTIAEIKDTTTISASAVDHLNVIAVGKISLSDGAVLTITGGADDYFVFNIEDGVAMSGGSTWVLSGGLAPKNVIFNMLPSSGNFGGTGSSTYTTGGIILAPHPSNKVVLTGASTISGAVVAGAEFSATGGSQVIGSACGSAVGPGSEPGAWPASYFNYGMYSTEQIHLSSIGTLNVGGGIRSETNKISIDATSINIVGNLDAASKIDLDDGSGSVVGDMNSEDEVTGISSISHSGNINIGSIGTKQLYVLPAPSGTSDPNYAQPITIINGDYTIDGPLALNGTIFVTGQINIVSGQAITGSGALVAQGQIRLSGVHSDVGSDTGGLFLYSLDSQIHFDGSNNVTVKGVCYAPNDQVHFAGTANATVEGGIYAGGQIHLASINQLNVSGGSAFQNVIPPGIASFIVAE